MSRKTKVKSFSIPKELQSGLEETINSATEFTGQMNIEALPLSKIELDTNNPRELSLTVNDVINGLEKTDSLFRKKQDELKQLTHLANSIKQQGLINPILVYKHEGAYKVVAGERRTLASLISGATSIQAKIIDKAPDDFKIRVLQWVENIQREDLSLWERLRNLEQIVDAYLTRKGQIISDLTSETLADILSCSTTQAYRYKNLLSAPTLIRNHIQNGVLTNLDKTQLIISSDPKYHQLLIDACKSGNTLKQMKTILDQEKSQSIPKVIKETRGRQATRINLGVTKNTTTAKFILTSVLNTQEMKPHIDKIDIDWTDIKSINQAFKRVLEILEKNH